MLIQNNSSHYKNNEKHLEIYTKIWRNPGKILSLQNSGNPAVCVCCLSAAILDLISWYVLQLYKVPNNYLILDTQK